jgi:hypothetical protein
MVDLVWFSAQALYFLKEAKASDFFFMRYTALNLPESVGGGREGISHHLPSQTRFTDGVWLGRGGDFEASNQLLSDHLLEDRVAGVAEATMPEFQVHGKSGRRGEVGCLWDGDGGALQVGDIGRVDLGLKHGVPITHE